MFYAITHKDISRRCQTLQYDRVFHNLSYFPFKPQPSVACGYTRTSAFIKEKETLHSPPSSLSKKKNTKNPNQKKKRKPKSSKKRPNKAATKRFSNHLRSSDTWFEKQGSGFGCRELRRAHPVPHGSPEEQLSGSFPALICLSGHNKQLQME